MEKITSEASKAFVKLITLLQLAREVALYL
jgi:hypothetical protein